MIPVGLLNSTQRVANEEQENECPCENIYYLYFPNVNECVSFIVLYLHHMFLCYQLLLFNTVLETPYKDLLGCFNNVVSD